MGFEYDARGDRGDSGHTNEEGGDGKRRSTIYTIFGGPGRTRTDMPLRTRDFESRASTNSTTGPQKNLFALYCSCILLKYLA